MALMFAEGKPNTIHLDPITSQPDREIIYLIQSFYLFHFVNVVKIWTMKAQQLLEFNPKL